MNSNELNWVKEVTGAEQITQKEVIQSLWSGYGQIVRLTLNDLSTNTVILKHIDLSAASQHPRGWNTDTSHQRKVKSYEVESNWYNHFNRNDSTHFKTANCIAIKSVGNNRFILLEDLDSSGYPQRKNDLNITEVEVCLKWLAHFHAYYLGKDPTGLWQEGTYWHLGTRPDEYKAMNNGLLKDYAFEIDQKLRDATYQTIVHGDAKVANFCFSKSNTNVAAVDFQYVGRGCGMKDVAYFMSSCLNEVDCQLYEDRILKYYFKELKKAVIKYEKQVRFEELEKEWRGLYSMAWADFTRFLLGWMPTHQKLNTYTKKKVEEALKQLNIK